MEVFLREGSDILEGGTETESARKLQQEPDVEIGKVALERVQGENAPHAPGIEAFLGLPVLHRPEQHFRQEQAHRILIQIVPDSVQRILRRQVPGRPERRFRVRRYVHLQDVHRQQQRHPRLLPHMHQETPPPILLRQRMHHHGILPELRVPQYDSFNVLRHRLFKYSAMALRALPR